MIGVGVVFLGAILMMRRVVSPFDDPFPARSKHPTKEIQAPNLTPQPIEYEHNERGDIILPDAAPFDGLEVLIQFAERWVQARWEGGETVYNHEGTPDCEGFCWVCLDDCYPQKELDDAKSWCPLPVAPIDAGRAALAST